MPKPPRVIVCDNCGTTFEQSGRGRTRRYCPTCAPPGAEGVSAWSRMNRRRGPIELYCVDCGAQLPPDSRKDRKRCDGCLPIHASRVGRAWRQRQL